MAWSRIKVSSLNHLYIYQVDATLATADTVMETMYPDSGQRSAGNQTLIEASDVGRVLTEFAFNPTAEKVNPVRLGSPWRVNERGREDVEWQVKAFVPDSASALAINLLNPGVAGDTFLIAHEWGTAANPGPDAFWVAGFGVLMSWPMEVATEGGILVDLNFAGNGSGLWRSDYVRS